MSQSELAKRMAARGFKFHQTTVARIEAGERAVRLGEAEALAKILKTYVHTLSRPPEEGGAIRRLRDAVEEVERKVQDIQSDIESLLRGKERLNRAIAECEDRDLGEIGLVVRARKLTAIRPEHVVTAGLQYAEAREQTRQLLRDPVGRALSLGEHPEEA